MTWWIWVLLGLFLLALEFAAPTAHLAFFGIGAFVVAVLVAIGYGGPLWVQLLVFTGFSLVALLLFRPMLVRRLKTAERPEVDTLVGELATPLEEIPVAAVGKAEMRGSTWNARNVGDTTLARGQRCAVQHIEGLLIHIRAL